MESVNPEGVEILIFSDNAHTRQTVMDAAGLSGAFDLPVIRWHQVASAAALKQEFTEDRFAALVLDADAQPAGGQSVARWLNDHTDRVPPVVMLVAREQDNWLSRWSGARAMVPAPYDPQVVVDTLKQVLRPRV